LSFPAVLRRHVDSTLDPQNITVDYLVHNAAKIPWRDLTGIAITCVAGEVAQAIGNDTAIPYSCDGSDYADLNLVVKIKNLSGEHVELFFEIAEQFVRDNWHAVDAVAQALLRKRTLQHADITAVLDGAKNGNGYTISESLQMLIGGAR
jgi:hypothetical protein